MENFFDDLGISLRNSKGKPIVLCEEPYITKWFNTNQEYITADAIDGKGNKYRVSWEIINKNAPIAGKCDWYDCTVVAY